MRHIEFMVPGPPRGKGRPRFTRTGRIYKDKKTMDYEALVQSCCMEECPTRKAGYLGYVGITMTCFYPIPKSTSKAKRKKMLGREICPSVKPDVDNVSKAILDALNGVAYRDDKQVIELDISKRYANPDAAGVCVSVYYLDYTDCVGDANA